MRSTQYKTPRPVSTGGGALSNVLCGALFLASCAIGAAVLFGFFYC
jgi:hypothetical protein